MRNTSNNKRYTGNMKTAVLSVILAVAVWIAVNYVYNPDITTTLSGLNIRFTGEAELRDRGLVVTGRNNIPSSSVVVSGKRKDLIDNMENVNIEIDVSNITETGSYSLTGSIALPTTKITVEKEKYGEIPITVEKLSKKEIPIKLIQNGVLKDKIVKSEPESNTVTITGAQSELDNVSYGIAELDISEISSDSVVPVKYLLLDKTGSYIEKNETLESYTAEVMVKNTVYMRKTLPIKLKLTEEMEKKYQLNEDKCSVSVTSAEVGVLPENTDDSVTVYIDKADSSAEFELSETSGMYIPENYKRIRVKLDLTEKVTKETELEPSAENLAEGLSAHVDKITVSVTGVEDKINSDNIKAHVNLEGLGEGTHSVPVEIGGDAVSINRTYHTNVTITPNR